MDLWHLSTDEAVLTMLFLIFLSRSCQLLSPKIKKLKVSIKYEFGLSSNINSMEILSSGVKRLLLKSQHFHNLLCNYPLKECSWQFSSVGACWDKSLYSSEWQIFSSVCPLVLSSLTSTQKVCRLLFLSLYVLEIKPKAKWYKHNVRFCNENKQSESKISIIIIK